MEDSKLRSGDFLKDVDISITIRSSGTDLRVLINLLQALTASAERIIDSEIVTIETEVSEKTTSVKKLRILNTLLRID